ncbi:uncharacterized protein K452DRAFT_33724 [Aplosporella prunicola CBS 121167]|uniref:Uncharacterized protein n=1 Tax=Aplosporella prunicola CBS 121167 TaxID=1176127 RepID=A0A6A6BC27_9PEZI|nr:uncharacterized protein K452DRAFT_33724 [Aplosporella prunicola CBS 121167]KAF2141782.1 hypothetical protein K452DRAFT_33724 [Aplosporella prunicola CBS 121167]
MTVLVGLTPLKVRYDKNLNIVWLFFGFGNMAIPYKGDPENNSIDKYASAYYAKELETVMAANIPAIFADSSAKSFTIRAVPRALMLGIPKRRYRALQTLCLAAGQQHRYMTSASSKLSSLTDHRPCFRRLRPFLFFSALVADSRTNFFRTLGWPLCDSDLLPMALTTLICLAANYICGRLG